MVDQVIVFSTLLVSLVLFISGRWRYDVVALLALLAVTITGVIPVEQAFAGFGHPAVITVAAILVVSRGLLNAGIVDAVTKRVAAVGTRPAVHLMTLTGLVAVCSAFMNNVGALALFMPIGIRVARRNDYSPSLLLMPLAFGSLLGGMTTLIGTPPNIIIATFRAENGGAPFAMFDFAPVGVGVAAVGVLFIGLVGWRLVPRRKEQASLEELMHIESYLSEVRVTEQSPLAGRPLHTLADLTETQAVIVALIRDDERTAAPSSFETLHPGDVLIVEATPQDLEALASAARLKLVGDVELHREDLTSDRVHLLEAVVVADSPMVGQSARSLDLRAQYGVNLLAVSRQGEQLGARLRAIEFRPGDVVLLQGPDETMAQSLSALGCLPLRRRYLRLGQPRRVFLSAGIFIAALGLSAAGVLPVQVTFVAAAVAMLLTNLLTLQEAYAAIDWPVIVLLGGMLPVGEALERSGGADLIADQILSTGAQLPPVVTLAIVLVGTMFLSDLINNAAAAVLMAPIGVTIAQGLGASPDPFLMAVAIGASCAFLTPIGHQSNTLVMGPGGYHFGDYWRMGLLLEVIIVTVALPLLITFWPLF